MKSWLVLVLVLTAACGDRVIYPPTAPAAPTPIAATAARVEFRVSGTILSARIRYADPIDGQTQVVTALPYLAQVTVAADETFLSLDVTPISVPFVSPFVSAQIFVNGVVFREASAADGSTSTLSVSGTWRP